MTTSFNYFNYFTEIEEHFWRKRGAHLLVSPLDWAIVETWQKAGIPLEAVLRGIDRAFESWGRSRRGASGRVMKSLAYCVDAVLEAAEEMKEAAAGKGPDSGKPTPAGEPFTRDELRAYITRNAECLRAAMEKAHAKNPTLAARISETRGLLEGLLPLLDSPAQLDLEDLERHLTVLEEKLTAAFRESAEHDLLVEIRREMDRALAPYRRKMTGEQLRLLESRYIQKRLFEKYAVPRLSLFYLT